MNIADVIAHKQAGAAGAFTIRPEDTVANLLTALAEHNVGALVVVDAVGDGGAEAGVVGIVSERDVVRHLAADGAATMDAEVGAIMTRDVFTCGPGDGVDHIAETMTQRRVRHVPVLDGGRLVGVVSIGDVVSSRIRQLEHDRGQLESYISG